MVVFSLVDSRMPIHPVDILAHNPIPFPAAWRRRRVVRAGRLRIPVLSIRDLIRLKRIAGRRQDLADIDNLRRLEKLT